MTKEHAYAYEEGYRDGIKEGIRRSDAVYVPYGNILKGMIDRYRDLIRDLRAADGWPDDDKLMDYGIDPKVVDDMNSEAKDMRGRAIFVGCKVSDGLVAGTVTSVNESQVWFTAEGSIGKKVRGKLFNKPENLLVIDPDIWRRQVTQ